MQLSIFIEIDDNSTVEQIKDAMIVAGRNAADAIPDSRLMNVDEEISFRMGDTNGYNASIFRPS